MPFPLGIPTVVMADFEDRDVLQRLVELFHYSADRELTLTGPEGESYQLTESVQRLLVQIVEAFADDLGVAIQKVPAAVPLDAAATFLNVPMEYVQTLLTDGQLTSVESAGVCLITLRSLITYRHRRDKDRAAALTELTRLSQELGLYK